MHPRKFVSIDHAIFFPQLKENEQDNAPAFNCFDTTEYDWGKLSNRAMRLPHLSVVEINAELRNHIHVRQYTDAECTTVNSCFAMSGHIHSSFAGAPMKMAMSKGMHNLIYKPSVKDDHYIEDISEPLNMLHLAIDRAYFLSLLTGSEAWCDSLKEKILRKEMISGCTRNMNINPMMSRVLHDLLHCPLTGPLRNLLIEAKVLELIAYQLHDLRSASEKSIPNTRPGDRDVFYAVKDYLRQNFDQEHSLRSLCKHFGLNEFKLKKGFKDHFGFTVFGYIHSLKMEYAKTLIQEAGLNVAQAACRSGYKNPNHFSAAFKKQFGLSPSSVRSMVP